MENLNNLIWTDEDSTNIVGIDPKPMKELCLVAFCTFDGPGITDTAGTFSGCSIDAVFKTLACLPG